MKTSDEEPSAMLREAVRLLRRVAIAQPRILPVVEEIERITESALAYERALATGRCPICGATDCKAPNCGSRD